MLRWWPFGPYVLVGLVHLASLSVGADPLSSATKVLLMPALLAGLLVALPTRRTAVALWGSLGILFSWVGDILLSSPGETGFVTGLGAFMLAHVAYLVLFLRPLRTRRIPPLTLLLVLSPYLGVLLVPVALYGAVIGSSTAASFGTSRVVAAGALFFLVSDTLLAFKMFWPGFTFWQEDLAVMLTYIVGQGLIAAGSVGLVRRVAWRHERSGRVGSPVPHGVGDESPR